MTCEREPEEAKAILAELLELRDRNATAVSATDLYVLGIRAGNDPRAKFNPIRMEVDCVRADASLAISKIGLAIEFPAQATDLDKRWDEAVGKMMSWIAAVQR
jgi:hypothetical protein